MKILAKIFCCDIIPIAYEREKKIMKKVLLIGADGMLGGELRGRLEKIYDVTRNND